MPRTPHPWFRCYVTMIWDLKLRCRPPAERWLWVALLGVARNSRRPGTLLVGDLPATVAQLADAAALPAKVVTQGLAYFAADETGMLVVDEAGAYVVANWGERQFESDEVRVRTAKHRSNVSGRNVPTYDVGTPPETETDTDTKTSSLLVAHNGATSPRKRRVPDDWQPTPDLIASIRESQPGSASINWRTERDKFVDYHGSRGTLFANVDQAFRNWMRKAVEISPAVRGDPLRRGKPSLADRWSQLIDEDKNAI
jgi:hypothetical protein